jgi:hypothetical protein
LPAPPNEFWTTWLAGNSFPEALKSQVAWRWIIMKLKNILQITGLLVWALPAFASDKNILQVEIRCQKTNEIKSSTGVYSGLNFATDFRITGAPLSLTKQRGDGEFIIFQQSYVLLSKDHRRAIIVTPWNQADQTFLLPILHKSKPMDWTNWQPPNYVETNAVSNFRFDYIPPDRSTNIPPNSFELRYKIE